jgi:hypothetical protein
MESLDNNKKNASIEHILDHGLVKPKGAAETICEMLSNLGVRFVFWDTAYSIIFAALTLAVILVIFAAVPQDYRYSATVTAAPMLFLLITAFAETSERASGLFELKQTCRFTVCQVAALRVICYSLASVVFTAIIAALSMDSAHEFMSMFTMSLAALFTCAALNLKICRRVAWRWVNAVFAAVWVFASFAAPFALKGNWEAALSGVPVIVSLVIAVVGAGLFAFQIAKVLSEVKIYAHA